MPRRILSDSQWPRVALLLPGKDGDPGRSARDNREFLARSPPNCLNSVLLWVLEATGTMAVYPEQDLVDFVLLPGQLKAVIDGLPTKLATNSKPW